MPRTRKLRPVRQKHANGCAIACVATLARKPYKKVFRTWLEKLKGDPDQMYIPEGGLPDGQFRRLKKHFRVKAPIVRAPCILIHEVWIKGKEYAHAVVIDRDGRILDPAED